MKSLQAEREKHNEQVHQAEAQLDDLLLQQQELLTESFTLYKQRHDFHRMISDLMEMREAAEAYKKWAKYGVWPTLDGERLGHLVMQKVEQLQRQRRSTLPIDDKGLQNKFAINEARTSQTHTILDPEMEKYENALNVKAFNDLQKRLKIPAEDVDALLPALMDARIKYETLSTAVETQSEEVLRLTALRQSEIDKEESIPHNEFDSVNFEDLDNETLTTAMMHEIYELYCEAG
ncbi:hypothetical protein M758_7G151300 [Ceratodon purpureus]|nr:hypothetical protein M758_7G151300 [Ceratodon purpureus]